MVIAASVVSRSPVGLLLLLVAACVSTASAQQTHYTVSANIPYRSMVGVDPNLLSLDVYAPRSANGTNAVMVMVHGGGFINGDKAGQPGASRPPLLFPKMEHYTGRGWVFASVNYRLTDPALPLSDPRQVSHPDHIDDIAAAIAWLKANVGRYGGDGRRIVLVGHSAGAGLVALAATDEARLGAFGVNLREIAGVVALDGFYDIPRQLPRAAPHMRLVFSEDVATQRDASPLFHAEPGKGIAPMLIVYNTVSPGNASQDQALAFVAALRAAGVNAEAYAAVGKSHAAIGTDLGKPGDPLSDKVDAFLDRLEFGRGR